MKSNMFNELFVVILFFVVAKTATMAHDVIVFLFWWCVLTRM
jgi:hypothetical protein